jgi:hypothetical protein
MPCSPGSDWREPCLQDLALGVSLQCVSLGHHGFAGGLLVLLYGLTSASGSACIKFTGCITLERWLCVFFSPLAGLRRYLAISASYACLDLFLFTEAMVQEWHGNEVVFSSTVLIMYSF